MLPNSVLYFQSTVLAVITNLLRATEFTHLMKWHWDFHEKVPTIYKIYYLCHVKYDKMNIFP